MLLAFKKRWMFAVAFFAFWMLGGTMFYSVTFLEPFDFFLELDRQQITLEGVLLPENENLFLVNLNRFFVYSPQILIAGNSELTNKLAYQKVQLSGVFRLFPSCANPGVTNVRTFYFQKRTVGYLEKVKIISIQKNNPWYQFMGAVEKLREKLFKKWDAYLKETFPLFLSLLTGQKTREFYGQSNVFQEVGVFHLFCVSGLHLGLVGGLVLWLVQKLFPHRHLVSFLIVVLFTFLYLCMANMAPSALRAWIMFSSYLLSQRLGRNTSQISYFLVALLVMVALDPGLIFDTGAQLSFASTLGIIFFLQSEIRSLSFLNVYLKVVWNSLGITLSAIAFNMPFLLVKGFTFSSLAFVGNLVVAPFLEVVLVLSLFIQPVAFITPQMSQYLGRMLYHLFKALCFIAQELTFLPHFFWDFSVQKDVIKGWLFWFLLLMIPIGLSLFRKQKTAWLKIVLVLVFSGLVLYLTVFIWKPLDKSEVWVLDVGQGLSIGVIKGEKAVLIDAGGYVPWYGNIGKNVIGRFLHFKGVKKIDSVFITHFHKDHTNGITGLMNAFGRFSTFVPASGKSNLAQGVRPVFELSSYQELPIFEDVVLKIFPVKAGGDTNNQALLFKICFPSFSILVTGDIEEEGIAELAPFLLSLRSEVIVMPHHGKYLQNLRWFLDKVKPRLAIISCGENEFGHPNPETIALLNELDIKTLVTRKEGAVCFWTAPRGGMSFASQGKGNRF
ncbi:DNA internalization-related competence protein ComEC/Rec2 [Thermatribacter velox]|jgi:competence protein ComEC|uniref:DNA internalization-related competence protein ComEC/Rec2 n=1 Tax=Thermatribacter velox TaxID=3039681 RepID=A0ABZ2Y890_9BACT